MDDHRHAHDLDGHPGRGPAIPRATLPAATFWLIELGDGSRLKEPQFLHVFDDGTAEWGADRTCALRFRTGEAARSFADGEWVAGYVVSEHPASELTSGLDVDHDEDDDIALA